MRRAARRKSFSIASRPTFACKAAAHALGFREMNSSRFQAQEAAIRKEKESSIRIILLDNLWLAREAFPKAKRIVGEAARKDTSPDVRAYAARLLGKPAGPTKKRGSVSGKQ
jgi:hypothetical protein